LLSVELNKIAVKDCPFYNLPTIGRGLDPGLTAAEMKRCVWVKPIVVCEVKFTEWTRDDRLRHPVFLGLRDDKKASEVVREKEN
jgi:bifunctional non-homologous end joining protein LigD